MGIFWTIVIGFVAGIIAAQYWCFSSTAWWRTGELKCRALCRRSMLARRGKLFRRTVNQ